MILVIQSMYQLMRRKIYEGEYPESRIQLIKYLFSDLFPRY
jgi:hypothetical protein